MKGTAFGPVEFILHFLLKLYNISCDMVFTGKGKPVSNSAASRQKAVSDNILKKSIFCLLVFLAMRNSMVKMKMTGKKQKMHNLKIA